MSNGPLGGNMGTPPVAPQPPQVSFTTTAESRGGFNNFLKSIPSTTAMTPLPPMGSPQMPPMGGNPMGNIDIFNQPPSMGMGMMGMNQPQMNPMMQPPMQQPMNMGVGLMGTPVQNFYNGGYADSDFGGFSDYSEVDNTDFSDPDSDMDYTDSYTDQDFTDATNIGSGGDDNNQDIPLPTPRPDILREAVSRAETDIFGGSSSDDLRYFNDDGQTLSNTGKEAYNESIMANLDALQNPEQFKDTSDGSTQLADLSNIFDGVKSGATPENLVQASFRPNSLNPTFSGNVLDGLDLSQVASTTTSSPTVPSTQFDKFGDVIGSTPPNDPSAGLRNVADVLKGGESLTYDPVQNKISFSSADDNRSRSQDRNIDQVPYETLNRGLDTFDSVRAGLNFDDPKVKDTTDIFSPSASDFANFQSTRDQLDTSPDVYSEGDFDIASSMNRGRSGGGGQNIAPQNSIQNALNRAARGTRGIELGDFPQTIGTETPSGFSAIGSGFTGQTPTTDTVFDIDTRPVNQAGFRDTDFEFDPTNYNMDAMSTNVVPGIGALTPAEQRQQIDSSPRPEDFEEKVGRDFNANRMADIERLYNVNVGQAGTGVGGETEDNPNALNTGSSKGTDPTFFEGLGVPGIGTTIGDFIERGSRERMANEIAMGRPMGLGETLFGYDANPAKNMEEYMSNVQPNYDFGDFNQTSKSIPEKQFIRNDSGRVIGIRDASGRVVSGTDPNAEIPSGDDNDSNPLILRPIAKAKEEEEEGEKLPNVIGGGETPAPVSSGSVVVDSPFTSNVGDFIPSSFNTGELNKLIEALTGVSAPRAMKQGGVAGYAEGGRVMQALDNLLATG